MEVIKGVNVDYEELATKVFIETIRILGGLKKLIEYRNLTWVPSLAEASYVIVLREIGLKSESDIAKELGITRQTVRNILRADPEEVLRYLESGEKEGGEHVAGGLAKLAYSRIKLGEPIELTLEEREALEEGLNLELLWAMLTLIRVRGLDFPVGKEELAERLKGIVVRGKPVEELLEKIEYPVKNPAELLHKLKVASE